MTERIRRHADVWRDVIRLDDAQLAEQIRADGIDILVDLSVHLAGHRLLALARKPAPVQVTYLGYPGTTGVAAIDYKLSDPYLEPEGSPAESFNTERRAAAAGDVFLLPPARPQPGRLRSARGGGGAGAGNGYVTFASVNTLLKVTPRVYETWSRILTALPTSRLIMQTGGLDDPATQALVIANFARHGVVAADRLEFAGFVPFRTFLELFRRVDIALDAFPYSSGTTTCHTLWMGVPVVTLAGETAVQRMGLSVLANVGLRELVATTPQQYVDIAVDARRRRRSARGAAERPARPHERVAAPRRPRPRAQPRAAVPRGVAPVDGNAVILNSRPNAADAGMPRPARASPTRTDARFQVAGGRGRIVAPCFCTNIRALAFHASPPNPPGEK